MSAKPEDPAISQTEPSDTMRRLQIGVAGVFAVLLLVGLAGVIGDKAREDTTAQIAAGAAEAPIDADNGGEPLVELGVQPSTNPEEAVKPPLVLRPLPRGTPVPDLQPDPALERARQKGE